MAGHCRNLDSFGRFGVEFLDLPCCFLNLRNQHNVISDIKQCYNSLQMESHKIKKLFNETSESKYSTTKSDSKIIS